MAHRTALIAAGSIAVVIVAGTIAVGANLGILNAADSPPVGKLSASTSLPTAQQPAAAPATPVVAAATTAPQQYVIKQAGSVSVTLAKSGVRLNDVSALRGWTWSLSQTRDSSLKVTFKHKSATYTFVATRGPRGSIVARVDHPITKVIAAPAAAAPAPIVATTYVATPAAAPASARPVSHGGDNNGGGGGGDHSDD
jgi:hypothetical protein